MGHHRDVIKREGKSYKPTTNAGDIIILAHSQVVMMDKAWHGYERCWSNS
ncbi:hypothetical protein [Xenorhabdus mauleonii]|nr:hypothetical protein [Xenorhabdus mauleonii]